MLDSTVDDLLLRFQVAIGRILFQILTVGRVSIIVNHLQSQHVNNAVQSAVTEGKKRKVCKCERVSTTA